MATLKLWLDILDIELATDADGATVKATPSAPWAGDIRQLHGYIHLDGDPDREPTEHERAWFARYYLGDHETRRTMLGLEPAEAGPHGLGLPSLGLGSPTCRWAFAGMTPQEVSDRYGDGRRILLTAPTDSRERILRGPRGEADDLSRREAAYDLAVESGEVVGGSPAD